MKQSLFSKKTLRLMPERLLARRLILNSSQGRAYKHTSSHRLQVRDSSDDPLLHAFHPDCGNSLSTFVVIVGTSWDGKNALSLRDDDPVDGRSLPLGKGALPNIGDGEYAHCHRQLNRNARRAATK